MTRFRIAGISIARVTLSPRSEFGFLVMQKKHAYFKERWLKYISICVFVYERFNGHLEQCSHRRIQKKILPK